MRCGRWPGDVEGLVGDREAATPVGRPEPAAELRHDLHRGAEAQPGDDGRIDSDEEAVISGTLRSPWKWEELIVESAVVGGRTRRDGKAIYYKLASEEARVVIGAVYDVFCKKVRKR